MSIYGVLKYTFVCLGICLDDEGLRKERNFVSNSSLIYSTAMIWGTNIYREQSSSSSYTLNVQCTLGAMLKFYDHSIALVRASTNLFNRNFLYLPLPILYSPSCCLLSSFCASTSTLGRAASFSLLPNPSISPTKPRGFGTGHSCAFFSEFVHSFGITAVSSSLSSADWFGRDFCRRLLLLFRPSSEISSSAKATRGAGQGIM